MADVEKQLQKLIKVIGEMGMHGEELRKWADKQLEDERQAKREEREALTSRIKEEREKIKELAALAEKQIELERLWSVNSTPQAASPDLSEGSPPARSSLVKSPRLPCFEEAKDQIDSYLLRFERYASVNGWNRSDWAIHLSALLKGKALDVYTRLSESEAIAYDTVKTALLKRYNLTQDGFQERFRKGRPEQGERISQFKTRIVGYLNRWIELSGKDKANPEDLTDLFVQEQLMNAFNRDLVVFPKERRPKSSDELVDLAEKYVEAHGTSGAFSKGTVLTNTEKGGAKSTPLGAAASTGAPANTLRCHRCNHLGHMKKDCRAKVQASVAITEKYCTFCHRWNHRVDECWEKKKRESRNNVAAITRGAEPSSSDSESAHCPSHNHVELKCGCTLPMLLAACSGHVQTSPKMSVADGWVNGKRVKVLRDSGSSCVVVRRGLVKPQVEKNGKQQQVYVYLADGKAVPALATEAHLESPYFMGKVSALEMANPMYDVILGNIPGAKCPGISLPEPKPESNEIYKPQEEVMAVETRAGKMRRTKPLMTSPPIDNAISVSILKRLQKQDESLALCRKLADTGETRTSGKETVRNTGMTRRAFS
ncbi:reverse transcriptase [Plakobranchus ocellatus]|uniref:Reverse transcriptase n=1 Tax=Plakobranchus ocellatus TaxID=259542 RepID=A0AAV4BJN3_9GAST|nr:reverse transcriptase [Plakobranchus ocellatus]